MFGVDSSELLVVILVAVVVIGPKDLPRVMRSIGRWVGKARGMANQFKSGVNDMVRDSEVAELEKKWREQNEAIMRANPLGKRDEPKPESDWGLPPPPAAVPVAAAGSPVPTSEAAQSGAVPRRAPSMPAGAGSGAVTQPRMMHSAADPVPTPEPEPVMLAATSARTSVSVAPRRPAPRAPTAS